jgi:hypothetical protein
MTNTTEAKEVRNTTETKEVRLLTADEIETVSGGGNGIPASVSNPGAGSWQSSNKEF